MSLGVWLLHDNVSVHKSLLTQHAIHDCGSVQLNHPAYSPDLTLSDYYLFRNLKCHLRGTRFADNELLEAIAEAWFEGHKLTENFFSRNKQLSRKVAKMH